ncbi:hypothetical protein BGZ80_007524, partial [Entomortierella chlamydospora]
VEEDEDEGMDVEFSASEADADGNADDDEDDSDELSQVPEEGTFLIDLEVRRGKILLCGVLVC